MSERPIRDASVRYRCFHPAEALLQRGETASVWSAARFYSDPDLNHDVYVFHRPRADRENFVRVLNHLKNAGKVLIADYDDLVFGGPDRALQSSVAVSGRVSPERAVLIFKSNLDAMLRFDRVLASTTALAQRAAELNPHADVRVLPNEIPTSISSLHGALGTPTRIRPRGTIGYFAGSRSHDKDLAMIAPALRRVLLEDRTRSLLVAGSVALPAELRALPNVQTAPAVEYPRLPGLMSACSTVVAPLEESEFTVCKSRVKFLEAAVAGARIIATPIPDMVAVGAQHVTFATSLDDWYYRLSEAPSSAELAAQAADNFAFVGKASTSSDLITSWS